MVLKLLLGVATIFNLYLFHTQIPKLTTEVSLFALLMATWGIFLYNAIYGFLASPIAKVVTFFLPYLLYYHSPKMFFGLFCLFMGFIPMSFMFSGLLGKGTMIMFSWLFTLPIVLQYSIFLFYYPSWVEQHMYYQIEAVLLLMALFYVLYLYSFSKHMLRNVHIVIEKGERQ